MSVFAPNKPRRRRAENAAAPLVEISGRKHVYDALWVLAKRVVELEETSPTTRRGRHRQRRILLGDVTLVGVLLLSAFAAGAVYERIRTPEPPELVAFATPEKCATLQETTRAQGSSVSAMADLYSTAAADALFGNKETASTKLARGRATQSAAERQSRQLGDAIKSCLTILEGYELRQQELVRRLERR